MLNKSPLCSSLWALLITPAFIFQVETEVHKSRSPSPRSHTPRLSRDRTPKPPCTAPQENHPVLPAVNSRASLCLCTSSVAADLQGQGLRTAPPSLRGLRHSWGSSSSGLTSTPHCSSVTAPCPAPGKVPQGTSVTPSPLPHWLPPQATCVMPGAHGPPQAPRATYPRTFIEGTLGLPGIIQEVITVKLQQDPPPPKVKGQLGSGPAHL